MGRRGERKAFTKQMSKKWSLTFWVNCNDYNAECHGTRYEFPVFPRVPVVEKRQVHMSMFHPIRLPYLFAFV